MHHVAKPFHAAGPVNGYKKNTSKIELIYVFQEGPSRVPGNGTIISSPYALILASPDKGGEAETRTMKGCVSSSAGQHGPTSTTTAVAIPLACPARRPGCDVACSGSYFSLSLGD